MTRKVQHDEVIAAKIATFYKTNNLTVCILCQRKTNIVYVSINEGNVSKERSIVFSHIIINFLKIITHTRTLYIRDFLFIKKIMYYYSSICMRYPILILSLHFFRNTNFSLHFFHLHNEKIYYQTGDISRLLINDFRIENARQKSKQ